MDESSLASIYLISEFGITDVGSLSELCKTLAEHGDYSPEEIETLINIQPGTLIEISVSFPKYSTIVNKNYKNATLCLLRNFHRKSGRYIVVNPNLSRSVIKEFWDKEEKCI